MHLLQPHHIILVYCLVDELLPPIPTRRGRRSVLTNSELVTILIWNVITVRQKTLKDTHRWLLMYHRKDFPRIPSYPAFVDHAHRLLPHVYMLLERLLVKSSRLRFMDSTMIPVCKTIRADRYKVAKHVARFGKNHQGWHYGFKLHASISLSGSLCAVHITPANVHDAQMMPMILNTHAKIAIGDTSYGARVMREHIWNMYGTFVLAYPHHKQNKKLMTLW